MCTAAYDCSDVLGLFVCSRVHAHMWDVLGLSGAIPSMHTFRCLLPQFAMHACVHDCFLSMHLSGLLRTCDGVW